MGASSTIYHAAARGYHIESLESDFEGDLDLRGFLAISKDVPKGYQKIRATFRVKTDASEDEIAQLYLYFTCLFHGFTHGSRRSKNSQDLK